MKSGCIFPEIGKHSRGTVNHLLRRKDRRRSRFDKNWLPKSSKGTFNFCFVQGLSVPRSNAAFQEEAQAGAHTSSYTMGKSPQVWKDGRLLELLPEMHVRHYAGCIIDNVSVDFLLLWDEDVCSIASKFGHLEVLQTSSSHGHGGF